VKRAKVEANAIAASMRRFDAKLSDAQIAKIAAGIASAHAAGKALNPKKKRLKNADQPATPFSLDVQ
jgi:mono/diheme cytochrome c family protein